MSLLYCLCVCILVDDLLLLLVSVRPSGWLSLRLKRLKWESLGESIGVLRQGEKKHRLGLQVEVSLGTAGNS